MLAFAAVTINKLNRSYNAGSRRLDVVNGGIVKIEVGEHLVRSWLRHVKNCQIAELNWKPSPLWVAHQNFQVFMDDARIFFKQALDDDIFKSTQTASQLLRQGEVDVLGIRFRGNNTPPEIYAIDIAFHEKGLNYGSPQDTVKRVLKKMLRSLMLIESYFDDCALKLIFCSPNVNPAYAIPLELGILKLQEFLASRRLSCDMSLLINGSFTETVLEPTIQQATSIADTSELFLRSYQLLNIVPKAPKAVVSSPLLLVAPTNGVKVVLGNQEKLPIQLDPEAEHDFKSALLASGRAIIAISYADGRIEEKPWNAGNFSLSSSVLGNLRSRPEFRQGEFQRRRIKGVRVTAIPPSV